MGTGLMGKHCVVDCLPLPPDAASQARRPLRCCPCTSPLSLPPSPPALALPAPLCTCTRRPLRSVGTPTPSRDPYAKPGPLHQAGP